MREAFRMTTPTETKEHENDSHEKHHELDHGNPISEIERIKEMMRQSTSDFDPSKYDKKYPTGQVSSTYVCYRCRQVGQHHIYMCPFKGEKQMKRSTGIPQSFMIKVDDPNMPGVYKTNTGYAVPAIDAVAYAQGKKERPPFLPNETREKQDPTKPVPKHYLCLLCSNIMTDAVVIPCCGHSYCDECIRNALLETEEHICPTCGKSEISPDSLIPNRLLRTSISSFQNGRAQPVIHSHHNGPGPQQPGAAPQGQTGPPVTQIPHMPPPRPSGTPVGANALPRQQMTPPSSLGQAPFQQLTTTTQDKVAPLFPQTTVTDEELAKGMTIKTTVGYRRPKRLDSRDLPKPRGPPLHFWPLPPMPPTRPPGPPPPPRFPPPNMPPPGAMLSMPPRIIPPQVLPGPSPAVMLGPYLHVPLPPPPGPIPIFRPTSVVYAETPLTRDEFYRTKKLLEETKEKKRDLIDDFAKELGLKRDQTKRKSLSRSRSRSRSRPRPKFRSGSFSRNRSHSRTPLQRSLMESSPVRSKRKTTSRRRCLTPARQRSCSRSRSRTPPKRSSQSTSYSPRRSLKRFSRSRSGNPVRSSLKRYSRSHSKSQLKRGKKDLPKNPERKKFSRSPDSKRMSPCSSKKRISQSSGKKIRSQMPSNKRLSRSPSKKIRSRSPSKKRLSRSPIPRRSSKSPSRKRSKSPTQNRPPFPPSKRFLSHQPRRRSRSPPYDNFRNDRPPYCSLKSTHQQGYPQRHYTQAQLSSNMQPGDPHYRTRSPFQDKGKDIHNQDKPHPEKRNADSSSETTKRDNNKKSSSKPQKVVKLGMKKEAKNKTDSNKVKQGTANTKEGAKKEGANKAAPKEKKPVANKRTPCVVNVEKEEKDKTSFGKETNETLAKFKKAPTKRVEKVKEAATECDKADKENKKPATKPKTETVPESSSEVRTTARSDPPSTSQQNAVYKAKKKHELSDSNLEADTKNKPNLKRPRTERVLTVPSYINDENENASLAKRQKTEPSLSTENEVGSSTDEEIESELEPLPVPEMDQLMVDPPEISKWEKEEERFTDSSPDCKSKAALEKKALPRSVIESARKVLSQKPMQPTLASAMSTISIKAQPAKTGHHVILDSEGTPEKKRRDRKLLRKSIEQSKGPSERSLTLSSVATPVQREESKPEKTHRALPMKESVMDKSKFEADYDEWTSDSEEGNTDKETASSRGSDVSQSQRPSSDTSLAKNQKLDEESQDKDKKHKHRHSRHKKHKKQKQRRSKS